MGSLRLTLCAGAVVAVALGPAAYAAEARGVSLTPGSPAPATGVRPAVRGCSDATGTTGTTGTTGVAGVAGVAGTTDARAADTTGRGGPVASAAFVADGRFVARVVGRHGTLPGGTGVLLRAAPGRYAVTAGCDGRTVKGPLTVGAPRAAAPTGPVLPPALASPAPRTPPSASRPPMAAPTPTPTGRESRSVPLSPSAPSSPVAPVPAGGGGTARVASSGARNTGPGVGQAVIGLVLASAAAVAVFARGARRDPGAE